VKKYVPRSIQNIFDRVQAFNESITEKLFSEELATTFEVVVYTSLTPQTKRGTEETTNSTSVSNYYFYSARSKAGHHDHLVSPESAKTNDEYEKFRNAHFQAIIKKSSEKIPQQGDVWLATHNGGNVVTLASFQRSGKIITDFKESGPAQDAHTSGEEPTSSVSDYEDYGPPLLTSETETTPYSAAERTDGKKYQIPQIDAVQREFLNLIASGEAKTYSGSNGGTKKGGGFIRSFYLADSYVSTTTKLHTATKVADDQKRIQDLTVGEIKELQKGQNPTYHPGTTNPTTLFAVGLYQIITPTLKDLHKHVNFTDDEVFAPELQDSLALALIYSSYQPNLRKYLKGSSSVTLAQAQNALASIWASIPKYSGKGVYDGDGSNKADGSKTGEFKKILKKVRDHNISIGFTE